MLDRTPLCFFATLTPRLNSWTFPGARDALLRKEQIIGHPPGTHAIRHYIDLLIAAHDAAEAGFIRV